MMQKPGKRQNKFTKFIFPVGLLTSTFTISAVVGSAYNIEFTHASKQQTYSAEKQINNYFDSMYKPSISFQSSTTDTSKQDENATHFDPLLIEKARDFSIDYYRKNWDKQELQTQLSIATNHQIDVDKCVADFNSSLEDVSTLQVIDDQLAPPIQQSYSISFHSNTIVNYVPVDLYTSVINTTASLMLVNGAISAGMAVFYFSGLQWASGAIAVAASVTSIVCSGILFGAAGNISGDVIGSYQYKRDYEKSKSQSDISTWNTNYIDHVLYWAEEISKTESIGTTLSYAFAAIGLGLDIAESIKFALKIPGADELAYLGLTNSVLLYFYSQMDFVKTNIVEK